MATLFIVYLALWLAKGAAHILIGIIQILGGLTAGLCGAIIMCLAVPVQALESLWWTAFPRN